MFETISDIEIRHEVGTYLIAVQITADNLEIKDRLDLRSYKAILKSLINLESESWEEEKRAFQGPKSHGSLNQGKSS